MCAFVRTCVASYCLCMCIGFRMNNQSEIKRENPDVNAVEESRKKIKQEKEDPIEEEQEDMGQGEGEVVVQLDCKVAVVVLPLEL